MDAKDQNKATSRGKNTMLNPDNVKLSCNEVTFVGHLLTDGGLKPDPDLAKPEWNVGAFQKANT